MTESELEWNWEPGESYETSIARIKLIASRANTPGYNEYGCALHGCHGYKHDAHFWAWVKNRSKA